MLQPHPDSAALVQRIARCRRLTIQWSGTGYRSTPPQYAGEADILSGDGSRLHGGRWNPPACSAVYLSATPEAAMAETLEHYRYYGLKIEDAMPRVFVAVDLRLHALLDVRNGEVRRRLRVSLKRMLCEDWRSALAQEREALTQAVGRAACTSGIEGLLVPSRTHADFNIIYFPANLVQRSRVGLRAAGADPI